MEQKKISEGIGLVYRKARGLCQIVDARRDHRRCLRPAVDVTTNEWTVAVCEEHASITKANGFDPIPIATDATNGKQKPNVS